MIGEVGVPLAGPMILGLLPLSADLSVFTAEDESATAMPLSMPGLPIDLPEREYTLVPLPPSVVVTGHSFSRGDGWVSNPDGPPVGRL